MPKLMSAGGIAAAVLLTGMAVTGCAAANAASSIAIPTAYVQQPAAPGAPVDGYLIIRNNGPADKLVAVHTSVGGTVVLRAPARRDVAPVPMHTVPDIPVPPDATLQLIPNSYHLLIRGAGPMHDGKDITLRLTFAHAGTITVLAMVTDPQSGGSSYFLN